MAVYILRKQISRQPWALRTRREETEPRDRASGLQALQEQTAHGPIPERHQGLRLVLEANFDASSHVLQAVLIWQG